MKILFLGPCRKINRKTGDLYPPFAIESRSGKFLRTIVSESDLTNGTTILFGNVIDSAVIDEGGKEYIPSAHQLEKHLKNNKVWSDADVVIALGGELRKAFLLLEEKIKSCEVSLHFMAHPAYVLRQPIGERELYIKKVIEIIERRFNT